MIRMSSLPGAVVMTMTTSLQTKCVASAVAASAQVSPTVSPAPTPRCFDMPPAGAVDSYGDGCEDYAFNPDWCNGYDDSDFSSNDMCCACGGGSASAPPTGAPTFTHEPTVSPAPTPLLDECVDSSNGATDVDDTGCDTYVVASWCGGYDDDDFSANEMCCLCGGGIGSNSPTVSPAPTPELHECYDTADGAVGSDGDGCEDYAFNPGWCNGYDDSDFSSNDMCCACGGGSASAFPTGAPTLTNDPTVSPAPTSYAIRVVCYGQLRNLTINMVEARSSGSKWIRT